MSKQETMTESRFVKEITIWVEFQVFPTQELLKLYKEPGLLWLDSEEVIYGGDEGNRTRGKGLMRAKKALL